MQGVDQGRGQRSGLVEHNLNDPLISCIHDEKATEMEGIADHAQHAIPS